MGNETRQTVYIETSVISYLAARASRDLVVAGHQQITQDWWNTRQQWDIYVSALVVNEAGFGDSGAASQRLALIENIPALAIDAAATGLARQLLKEAALPGKAMDDALHIAVAAVNGMDYLLTWNCTHIANATKRPLIMAICEAAGYRPPVICTPEELSGAAYVE